MNRPKWVRVLALAIGRSIFASATTLWLLEGTSLGCKIVKMSTMEGIERGTSPIAVEHF